MQDWKKILLKPKDSIGKAIDKLNSESIGIILVVNEEQELLGTVTDGDIRRAMLNKLNFDTFLEKIMHKNVTTASLSDDKNFLLSLMQNKDLLHIPLVDQHGKIVGLDTLKNLMEPPQYENPVFLMAGGFGKRLHPLTADIPKPLLKIGAKPILETILNQFKDAGFKNFYVSTHFQAEKVSDYFGNGSKWEVSIEYVHEEKPLGTAGALGLLPKQMIDLPLILMNGDLLSKLNYQNLLRYHEEHEGVATMCITEYQLQIPFGVVESKNYVLTQIEEKPSQKFYINAGIYVLNPEIIKNIDGSKYLDMPTLIQEQIDNSNQVNVFPIHEYWLDIGQITDFNKAKRDAEDL